MRGEWEFHWHTRTHNAKKVNPKYNSTRHTRSTGSITSFGITDITGTNMTDNTYEISDEDRDKAIRKALSTTTIS